MGAGQSQKRTARSVSIGQPEISQVRLGRDPANLLKKADQAMYDAKKQGRNAICFYQENSAYSPWIVR
ncbi:MAG: diguanylate cyclase [Candidatus Saccharibacteria bacterium]|nr:diguanylate cyclase [Rhodoferax sp.]